MFGITSRKNNCSADADFRNNYCGICKSIAYDYGNSLRLSLNNDVVFLSELYDSLTETKSDYSKISHYNCFSIPENEKDFPFNLKYASAVNVLLTKYKIEDNVNDSKLKAGWRLLNNLSSKKSKKAELYLKKNDVDTEKIADLIRLQTKIEKENNNELSIKEIITKYSEPTAKLTSEIYKGIINFDNDTKLLFSIIGYHFGRIVYLNDAIEDVEKDSKNKVFNILLASTTDISSNKKIAEKEINNSIFELKASIKKLPMPEERKAYFIGIIESIYQKKIELEKIDFKNRIKLSYQSAINISKKYKYYIPKYTLFGSSLVTLTLITILFPNIVFAYGSNTVEAGCCGSCCDCFGQCCCNQESCNCSNNCKNPGDGCDRMICKSWEDGGCGGCFLLTLGSLVGIFGCCIFGSVADGCSSGSPTKVIIIKQPSDCGCGN